MTLYGDGFVSTAHACGGNHYLATLAENAPNRQARLPGMPSGACTGPMCSTPAPSPMVPESPTVPTASDPWGHWAPPGDDGFVAAFGWIALDDELLPPPLATSIFHPPR
jgi:hypothetical protein